jgi:hypothetical protein
MLESNLIKTAEEISFYATYSSIEAHKNRVFQGTSGAAGRPPGIDE